MNNNVRTRILELIHADSSSPARKGPQAFGFYWTRKNSELARRLVREFTQPGSVVLDPFLGAGSSAIGAVQAGEDRLFVGVEINEMPVENLKLTLGSIPEQAATDIARFKQVLESIRDLYSFQLPEGRFEVQKVVHDIKNSVLSPIAFVGLLNGKRTGFNQESESSTFAALRDSYRSRTHSLGQRDNALLAENSRIAVKSGMQVSDVFGPLGFEALSILREQTRGSLVFRLIIGSCLHLCRLTDKGSQSQFPFWFPKQQIHEKSVFDVADRKLSEFEALVVSNRTSANPDIVSSYADWCSNARTAVLLLTGSTSHVLGGELPEESVDLVLTDPPYFDQVPYAEYLKLWEHFTGFRADLDNEIVESTRVGSGRSRTRFLDDLSVAFRAVRKTMKPEAVLLVYFKDSKPRNLHDFILALERAGLVFQTQCHISNQRFTYKQNASQENTVGGDSLMVFFPEDGSDRKEPVPVETLETLDGVFVSLFSDYIDSHGPSTLTEALDNSLIQQMYPTGYLSLIKSSSHFNKLISENFQFERETRKWSRVN